MGAAVARHHLLNAGAEVIPWDVNASLLELNVSRLATIGRVACRTVDVSDDKCVAEAAVAAQQDFGRIDILVNCAGVASPVAPVESFPVDEWARVMRVNLDGVFHCCRALVPRMLKLRYVQIANTASVVGKEGNPNASAYSVSKAGVTKLTKCSGRGLASKGICVNAITPV